MSFREVTIESDNGVRWVFQNHRDKFEPIRRNEIKAELRDNSTIFGDHICLKRYGKQMRLVANHEAGYILGETVRDFFEGEQHFVWCEQVDDGNSLIVVVSDGEVLLDARIPPAQIDQATMSAIANSSNPFNFFVWGDVPILRPNQLDTGMGRMAFSDSVIQTFNELEGPILNELEPNNDYMLVPLEQGIANADFGISKETLILLAILLAGAALFYEDIKGLFITPQTQQTVEYVDPWSEYRQSLATPAPDELFHNAYLEWLTLTSMPLITPAELTLESGSYVVKVEQSMTESTGMSHFMQWAENKGWTVMIQSGEIRMTKNSPVPSRGSADQVRDHGQQMGRFFDDLQYLMNGRVSVGSLNQLGNAYTSEITLEITEASQIDILTVKELLSSSTMNLKSLRFDTLSEMGDFTIELQLVLLGY